MTSTLGCLGLAVPDENSLATLLDQLWEDSAMVGRPGAVQTRRWADPGGALVTVIRHGEQVVDVVPSFAGQLGAQLGEVAELGAYTVGEVKEGGETVTRLVCHVPQAPYLPRVPIDFVDAGVTALGVEVSVHADAAAFADDDASLLGDGPQRYAAESFVPLGLFGDEPHPLAWLSGEVLASETRTTELTGQRFHALLLRTVGFVATACLAVDDHPDLPPPGAVVAGRCYLVADLPGLWKVQPKPKRGWLRAGRPE